MKKTKKIIMMLCLIASIKSYSQNERLNDTVVKMNEVIITSNRIHQFTPGNKVQTIDSTALKNNATNTLGDILSLQTQVQINSHGGIGSLSEPSFRGTGSAHTAILWNGFNLQDILNGGIDFSQIPGFFLDEVNVQSGGCSALYGSGAIGGAINLDNNLLFGKGISASLLTSYGSFSNYYEGAQFSYSNNKYACEIKVFDQSSSNDYDFINIYKDSIKQVLNNNQLKQQGAMLSNSIKINQKQKLTIHLWFQYVDHNLPSLMNDTSTSHQNQKDQFIRRSAEWSRVGDKSEMFLRTGYFNSFERYENPAWSILSTYSSFSSITEFENNYKFCSNLKLNSGINYIHEKGISTDFIDNPYLRDRSAIFASLKYNTLNNAFNVVTSFREEEINSKFIPVTYSAGLNGEIIKGLFIKGNVNKSYRIPDFEDLYYKDNYGDSGNPNLKSEEGFNEELGLNYKTKIKSFNCDAGITAFNSNVTNWILWMPQVNNPYSLTPVNVDTVWSRGLEFNADISFNINKVSVKLSGNYTILSTTNESKSVDSTRHKQLIYVPKQKVVANLIIGYKGFSLSYNQSFVDKRFATSGNSVIVKAYNTANFIISKEFYFKDYALSIDLHINNTGDLNYQVMQYYPMPLRNYQLGLRLDFNKPK